MKVTDKPFGRIHLSNGESTIWKGHNRWYDFGSIKIGTAVGLVSVNTPESAVPGGETYKV